MVGSPLRLHVPGTAFCGTEETMKWLPVLLTLTLLTLACGAWRHLGPDIAEPQLMARTF